jgi:hypothetical protein
VKWMKDIEKILAIASFLILLLLLIPFIHATMVVINYNKSFNFVVTPNQIVSRKYPPDIEIFTFSIINQEPEKIFIPQFNFSCEDGINMTNCCKNDCIMMTNSSPVYPFKQVYHNIKCMLPMNINATISSSCKLIVGMIDINTTRNVSILFEPQSAGIIPQDLQYNVKLGTNMFINPLICFSKTCYYNTVFFFDLITNPPKIGSITLDSINLLEIALVVLVVVVLLFF